jgi:hypothetical protein
MGLGLASRSTVLLLLSWVSLCISADQLSPAKPHIFPDGKLISNNGVFALGFFCPTNSSTRFYIGIWYNNDPERTVVWVANRDSPIATPSASATLAVTNRSDLVLSDTQGHIYWTTRTTSPPEALRRRCSTPRATWSSGHPRARPCGRASITRPTPSSPACRSG